jgi:hypothetical protein
VSPWRRLTSETRRELMLALHAGRLAPPYTALALRRYVGAQLSEPVAAELGRLADLGMSPAHVREVLAALDDAGQPAPEATLVWTGPELIGATSRDTSVVVRELFEQAQRSVLVAGFAVYQGHRVFKVLAERMDTEPALAVTMFLNVERPRGDTTSDAELLKGFADRFGNKEWPGNRLPAVFYDPRAVEPIGRGKKRASLHAKCIVVDDARALVTSANFTEAAQERNLEAGVLVESPSFAAALRTQFDVLVAAGYLLRVPGLG